MGSEGGYTPSPGDNHVQRRQYTRYNVSNRDDCILFIDEKAYLINNLSLTGLGLLVPFEETLTIGETIGETLNCKVKLAGQMINNLDYKIVYISPDHDDIMKCGLEWVNRDSEKEDSLQNLIQNYFKNLNDRF